jgi:predicted nucleic acid-binding Zn ribbon protein
MKTRICIILLFSFISIVLHGQELKPKQIRKIESFGIEYNRLRNENIEDNNFTEILNLDRKRKKNKTIGYVFSSLGLLTVTGGILALANIKSNPNNDMDESGAYQAVIGGILTSIGAIEIGVSIPLFISSKKRKNERNQRIIELNPNFKE